MYKDRMKRWGLVKNIKEHEAIAILHIASERVAEGKKTLIQKHNQVVEIERFLRHARRKGIQNMEQSPACVPAYISCTTPPPELMPKSYDDDNHLKFDHYDLSETFSASSISLCWTTKLLENHETDVEESNSEWSGVSTPSSDEENFQRNFNAICGSFPHSQGICRSPSPPTALGIPEQLFYNIRTYYAGSFDNGAWIIHENGGGAVCPLASLVDSDPRNELQGYCSMAAGLRRNGSLVEFRRVLSKAFGLVQCILLCSHPRTLDRLFESFLFLIHNGLMEVAFLLRDYLRGLATNFTSGAHPWGRIFRLIGALDEVSLEQAITKSWQCNNDALDDGLGPFSDFGLLARLNHIFSVYETVDPHEEERIIKGLLEECERVSDQSSTQVPTIMMSLGHCMMAQEKYVEAENLGLDILSRARNESRISLNLRVDAMILAARSQYHQHKILSAENSMRDAICMLVYERGKAGPLATRYMHTLEIWLREWGRDEDADVLKVAIHQVIGLDETDMEQKSQV
jgi:hypothetical protein